MVVIFSTRKSFFNSVKSPSYIGNSPLIYSANQWAGFYKIESSVMKE